MNTDTIKTSFAQRFNALRRRYLLLNVGMWLCIIFACLLTAWLLVATYDYFFEASVGFRRIIIGFVLLSITLAAVWILNRQLERSQHRRFANLLESTFADFGQRLRTTLDVLSGRVRGPEPMLGALANQTLGRWETAPLQQVLPKKQFFTSMLVFAVILCGVCFLVSSAGQWRTAMMRAVGTDDPYTTLSVYPGNTRILEGAQVAARLELTGRPERAVTVVYRAKTQADPTVQENWIEASLLPKPTSGANKASSDKLDYEISFGKMTQDIEYQFRTDVGTTPSYKLSLLPLIRTTAVNVTVTSPAYTGMEQRLYSASEVTVLRNSGVSVSVTTNHPLESVTLKAGVSKSKLAETIKPERGPGNTWVFSLPSDDSLYWSFEGVGESGVPMESIFGRLRVRDDTEPKLYWRSPNDGFESHALAELPMSVVASDDYGLKKAGIVFQLGEEEFVLKEWTDTPQNDSSKALNTSVTLEDILPLESFQLTEHEYVSYYAYATDNREPSPQRIETDLRYIDIRPLRQQYALEDLDDANMGGDGRQSLLQPLGEIIRRQRFVINRTKRFANALPNDTSLQLNTVDRLVENQSELASLVRFLSTRLAEQGSDGIEALGQAETLMLQAADSLSAASFDTAFTQENDALRALAEARNQALTLIANQTQRQQIRRMRDIARQLRQKLRMDQPRTETQIADSLEALAREQSLVTDKARLLVSNSPSGQKASEPNPNDADNQELQDGKVDAVSSAAIEDEIKKQQLHLQDRFADLSIGLERPIEKSALLAQRIKNVSEFYKALERGLEWNAFEDQSQDLTALLSQTALHLRALAPTEPVGRLSELRAMAVAIGGSERQIASSPPRRTKNEDSLINVDQTFKELVRSSIERAETARDVLQLKVDVGDVETSEINDALGQFVQRTKFDELLDTSHSSFEKLLQEPSSAGDVSIQNEEATSRSREYHEVAQLLDELYQQLMTPKLDQLRQLEEETSDVASMMSGQGGDTTDDSSEDKQAIDAALNKLRSDIKASNLEDLLTLLDSSDPKPGDNQTKGTVGSDVLSSISGEGQGNPNSVRVNKLLQELRKRIQHMILMEISPERDIPVPQRYKRAVDSYFERIAGASDESMEQP